MVCKLVRERAGEAEDDINDLNNTAGLLQGTYIDIEAGYN
jgi:hypothetical protein